MALSENSLSPALPPGQVFTFYSYKGGTGRSMLLANVAWMLASAGSRVLMIDWDLEAPGLHRYFKPFLGDDPELRHQEGVMEWLTDYWDASLDHPDTEVEQLVCDFADPRHYVRKLETGTLLSGGIDLLCAGRQDRRYAESVADFDFTRLFQKLRGEAFIDATKRILTGPGGYDHVLVDARTGVSDTSGFCTVSLADALVVCFTYNNQSVLGASHIARDIKQQAIARRQPMVDQGRLGRFRLFAVPCRIEEVELERLERRQNHAWSLFADLIDVAPIHQTGYWLSVQVRHQSVFAYEEMLAACVNRDSDPQSVLGAVKNLTRVLTDDAFSDPNPLSDDQRRDLRERFGEIAASTVPLPMVSAWQTFHQRVPDPGAKASLLQGCFPLLCQLYTVNARSQAQGCDVTDQPLVRCMVLESDLSADEHRMADMLASRAIVQLRISSEDKARALIVSDESIWLHWDGLRNRLLEQCEFIRQREAVRLARRSWDTAGRTIAALRALQSDFASLRLTDEQRTWMGRRTLQMFQAVQDLHETDMQVRDQIDRLKAELTQSARLVDEIARTERRVTRLRVVAFMLVGILGGVSLVGYSAQQRAQQRFDDQQQALQASLDSANKASAESAARLADVNQRLAQATALSQIGMATSLFQDAKKFRSGDPDAYAKGVRAAVDAYSRAIESDPNLPEAYRGRAQVQGNAIDRDVRAELADWAAYYDLRPSLKGRLQLVIRAAREDVVDATLMVSQLGRLTRDATQPSARDIALSAAADALEKELAGLPSTLHKDAQATIDNLRKLDATESAEGRRVINAKR